MKKKVLALIMTLVLTVGFSSCSNGGDMQPTDLIDVLHNYIIMENDNLRVQIDRSTGYVSTVKNLKTGFVNKNSEKGKWPFYIEFSENGYSVETSSISADTLNRVSRIDTYTSGGRDYLKLTYDDLVLDEIGEKTGIAAVVLYSIAANDEYFKFNVSLDLDKAKGDVMSLHLASGGDLRSGDGADEYLTAPVWGTGTKWKNPINNTNFSVERTLAYPGSNAYSLEAGWMDLSGSNQGIGIAYINKQQLACEFRFCSTSMGMSIDVVLFEPMQILGRSVPLKKGEKFTSDDLVVGVHTGSWHTFADIYREEYQKAFVLENGDPDYLTTDTISKLADSFYYYLRETGNYSGTGTNPDGSQATFADMWRNIQGDVDELDLDYEKLFLWIVGINQGTYGKDVPHLLPLNENLADEGETALQSYEKHLIDGYKAAGGSIMNYTHPFAMDYEREDLAALMSSINPGQHEENWNAGKHYSVCTDNDTVYNLWKDTLIPEYKTLGSDGVQFDQGSLVQTICDMEGHNHGLDAVSRLSSAVKSLNALAKLVRSELGDDAFILSEASNDLTCRYIDIRQNHWMEHPPKWGGEFEYGTSMYTHPQYIYSNCNFITLYGGIAEFYLESAVLGGLVLLTDGPHNNLKKESVRFVTELRSQAVPGYPHGYRDTLGLKWDDTGLFVRVYVDSQAKKVSVLYCSNATVTDAAIEVDLEKLGFAGKGKETINVSLDANKADYQIVSVD